jgi:sn-glycerol 3-phosphate transport system permease protein
MYILPAVAVLIVFIYWPMIYSVVLSFYEWNFISPTKYFRGFGNYTTLATREFFWTSGWNTGKYVLGLLPLEMVFPVGLAVLVSSIAPQRIQEIFKVFIFSPAVLSFAVTCYVWLWIFNPLGGLSNYLLSIVGISPVSWLTEKKWALWSIVVLSGWRQFGYSLVLYTAALSAIPSQYIEAARIDGVNNWQLFWKIKWPLISPTTFFILITTIIFASTHAFIPIHILTQGGPHNSTSNLIYLVYVYAFKFFNVGLASTGAVLLFAVFLLITFLQLRYVERYVHYGV